MVLEKLDQAYYGTKLVTAGVCISALIMYLANGQFLYNTVSGLDLLALGVQLFVVGAELISHFCLEVPGLLPNNLRSSLLILLVDSLVAFFPVITGLGGTGIFDQESYDHVCFAKCKVALFYSIIVTIAGALGLIATVLKMVVAAKMNIERHQFQA